jgi:transcriptional regulator with XRE-family HTH domain
MTLGERLRFLRKQKGFSLNHVEKRSGLYSSFISRIENGHSLPGLETLERLAQALEIPLYLLFYEGKNPPEPKNSPGDKMPEANAWEMSRDGARFLARFRRLLGDLEEKDRRFLLGTAQRMTRYKKRSMEEGKAGATQDRPTSKT